MNEVSNVFMTTDAKPIKIDMNLDIKDIFDVLVTEQEQIIENQIASFKQKSESLKKQVDQLDKDIDVYMEKFVKEKYDAKIQSMSDILKSLTISADIQTEITDGNVLPKKKRPSLVYDPSYESRENIIVVSLSISNKHMDRNTINNAVTFFLETPFDEHLIKLTQDKEDITKQKYETNKKITEFEKLLEQTDRLLRKAKATLTKKVLGKDLEGLLDDVRSQFPNLQIDALEKKE